MLVSLIELLDTVAVTIVPSGLLKDNISPLFNTWPQFNSNTVDLLGPAQPVIPLTVAGVVTDDIIVVEGECVKITTLPPGIATILE